MKKIMLIFGTRPEAIKMAPIIKEIEKRKNLEYVVCVSGQHREMLDQVLEVFDIKPQYDLNIMKHEQTITDITVGILTNIETIIKQENPDIILVHGDTTTAFSSALAAFYNKVAVGHVEAGLRTYNKFSPYPEEINRQMISVLSDYHFAPTDKSCDNLIKSQIPKEHIYKTGNTVIDALLYTVENYKEDVEGLVLNPDLKTILLTSHRRENFGEPIREICKAVLELINNNKNIEIVYPVHPNPNVRKPVYELLGEKKRIHLIEPLEYAQFCSLMKKSHIILTDSGGVQEEAPSLGKPVLVLRDTTERPEAIEYGTVKLVGTNREKIVSTVQTLLNNEAEYKKMAEAINPYGDGLASKRIVDVLMQIKKDL